MKTRVLTAVIALPLLIVILYYKGIFLFLGLTTISFIALREFYNSVRMVELKPIDIYGYGVTLIYYSAIFFFHSTISFTAIMALTFILLMVYVILVYKNKMIDVVLTVFGVFYVTFFFGHLLLILDLKYSDIILLLPFITAWCTDTFAYLVGLTMGKRKLCPLISPKKSVEGAIGGAIGCVASTAIFGGIVNAMGYPIPLIHFIVLGLLCGVFSQFGDLTASLWKRYTGIKDFGKIFPGHGGILDRFDSIIFTLPIIYYYFTYIVLR